MMRPQRRSSRRAKRPHGKAKELDRAIVKVVHRMIKEANPEMNALCVRT